MSASPATLAVARRFSEAMVAGDLDGALAAAHAGNALLEVRDGLVVRSELTDLDDGRPEAGGDQERGA